MSTFYGVLIIIIFGIMQYKIKKSPNVKFKTRKYMDMMRYLLFYIIVIPLLSTDIFVLSAITLLFLISSTFQMIVIGNEYKKYGNDNLRIILISCLFEFFISVASTYYILYLMNPSWFDVSDNILQNEWKCLFEFLYLTFCIFTTYSGGNINLVGIMPRLFQMIHVILILTIVANTISYLLANKNENK